MPAAVGVLMALPLAATGVVLGFLGFKLTAFAALIVFGACALLRRVVSMAAPDDSSAAYRICLAAATRLLVAVALISASQGRIGGLVDPRLLDPTIWQAFGLLLVWFYLGRLCLDVLASSDSPSETEPGAVFGAATR